MTELVDLHFIILIKYHNVRRINHENNDKFTVKKVIEQYFKDGFSGYYSENYDKFVNSYVDSPESYIARHTLAVFNTAKDRDQAMLLVEDLYETTVDYRTMDETGVVSFYTFDFTLNEL